MTSATPEDVMLRLFVAIELPDGVRDALSRSIGALRGMMPPEAVRWVRPEGIHVTLKFLGAVEESRLAAIHSALRLAARDARPFDLRPDAIGSFGGRRNVRVVWAGVGGDVDGLTSLAARVEDAVAPLGFGREQRALNAHLTLARVRDETPPVLREQIHAVQALARRPMAALAGFEAPVAPPFRVERVSLMRSTLGRGGAVYSRVGSYALGGEAAS